MDHAAPIRSRAADEGNIQIPLWSVPLVLVVLYICLFSGLGALGLVTPDEPRYAAIARAMAETHDWVTPRLWGTPWFEKPVLYYWTAGAAMRVFGVSEFAARLPSALVALLAVLATAWTALRSYGIGAAWYALLMLPTSVAMIGFARAASPDMLFAGLLTAAMAVACEMLQKPRPGPLLRIAFGFFLGAAVLAKGPAAVILAGGATLLWAALSRQWRASFRFLHPLIIAVFCVTALPWYILCALRNPDFLRVFIWQHNFQRYLTPVFEHRQPFWFFAYILMIAMVPWVWVFCALGGRLRRKASSTNSPGLFFASWSGFIVLFFSLSQSKLPGYILPAIPPLFVLLGGEVARSLEQGGRSTAWQTGATGFIFLALAGLLAEPGLRAARLVRINDFRYLEAALFIAVVGGLSVLVLSWLKRPRTAFIGIVLLMIALLEIVNVGILPQMSPLISSRELANTILSQGQTAANVAEYKLPRSWGYGLHYYFGKEPKEWTPEMPQPDWIITTPQAALDVYDQGMRIQIVDHISPPTILLLHVMR
ncbi:MAG: glycosyltransferase family 39 protein [Acidobacteriia bacterium]|nr:glycosyltransferase family 39 protein [Terriglobia bacterium]